MSYLRVTEFILNINDNEMLVRTDEGNQYYLETSDFIFKNTQIHDVDTDKNLIYISTMNDSCEWIDIFEIVKIYEI